MREFGIIPRNCVSSNPHFFPQDRGRDRSLLLDKLLSGRGDKLLGKNLLLVLLVLLVLLAIQTLQESTQTVAMTAAPSFTAKQKSNDVDQKRTNNKASVQKHVDVHPVCTGIMPSSYGWWTCWLEGRIR